MPRKFFPRRLSASQRETALALVKAAEEKWRRARPRVREYERFCRANGMDPALIRENLPFLIAQQEDDGLGPRTIRVYCQALRGYYNKPTYSIRALMDVCKQKTVGASRRHAEDFEDGVIHELLDRIHSINAWAGVVATMMFTTGLRYCDLAQWEALTSIHVCVHTTKISHFPDFSELFRTTKISHFPNFSGQPKFPIFRTFPNFSGQPKFPILLSHRLFRNGLYGVSYGNSI